MINPHEFVKPCGVLNVGLLTVLFLYVVVGFLGYWRYGKDTEASIVWNIPSDEL